MKIGILINHGEDRKGGAVPSYTEMREMAQAVEANGFDSAWVVDHLFFRFEEDKTVGIWECWTLLTALAEATNKIEWGTLVLCNPFRNPALLAKMAHTLDEVSQGRLILGVGCGWHQPEFDAFGYPFDHRVGRFEEALQIMQPLLKGKNVSFDGDYYQVKDCEISPLGPRADGVPLLVASFQPRMLRLTAQYADQWNTAWLGDPQPLGERIEMMNKACEKVGRDPATLTKTVGISVSFPELGEINAIAAEPLTGSVDDVARAFAAYEKAGADHLQVNINPYGLPALEKLAEAVRIYRG